MLDVERILDALDVQPQEGSPAGTGTCGRHRLTGVSRSASARPRRDPAGPGRDRRRVQDGYAARDLLTVWRSRLAPDHIGRLATVLEASGLDGNALPDPLLHKLRTAFGEANRRLDAHSETARRECGEQPATCSKDR
ncbi:hypothetical protein GCM10009602_32660 [Nocardiopsis tropica]